MDPPDMENSFDDAVVAEYPSGDGMETDPQTQSKADYTQLDDDQQNQQANGPANGQAPRQRVPLVPGGPFPEPGQGGFFNPPTSARPRGPPPMGMAPRGPPPPMFRPPFGGGPPRMMPPGMMPYGGPRGGMMPPGGYGGPGMGGPGGGQQPQSQHERLKQVLGLSPDQELWVETASPEGKPYFYNAVSRQTVWERPGEGTVVMTQAEVAAAVEKSQASAAQRQPPAAAPQGYGMPPGGFMPYGYGPPMGGGDPSQMWQEYTAPDGRKYYYNLQSGETTWDKPQALKDREGGGSAISPSGGGMGGDGGGGFDASGSSGGGGGGSHFPGPMSKSDSARPVSSNPVAGTPWCVVWTGDHKVFFFNPSSRTSVWERPPELYGRPDVDLLVSKPPKEKPAAHAASNGPPFVVSHANGGAAGGSGVPDPSGVIGARAAQIKADSQAAQATDAEGPDGASGSDDEDQTAEDEDQAPPAKRRRDRKREQQMLAQQQQQKPKVKERPLIEPKPLDPAIEAEMKAAKERAKIPAEIRVEKFRLMLTERGVSAFSTWEKELSKIVFDERYLLLGAKERKEVFETFVKERAEEERAEKKKKAKEAKEGFKNLLEEAKLHGKSSFSDFASKYGKDARFKGIEKMREKETLFDDFVGELRRIEKEERRAQKEKLRTEFLALLAEQRNLTRRVRWSEVKKTIDGDPRYKAVDSSTQREEWFREFAKGLPEETNSDEEEETARVERLERVENEVPAAEAAALADRQREVEAELGEQRKERTKELERHKFNEAEQHFQALLADTVKQSDANWKETRRALRKDKRWELADLLDKQQKERIFDEHIRNLERKRKDLFYQLLDEMEGVTMNSHWRDVRKLIKEDARFTKICNSDRKTEREFRDYIADKQAAAKNDFRELLRETKIITYKSKQMIAENEQHLKDILAVLENDKRYLVLNATPDDREKALDLYLDELDRRGPPPPPTQQEPSRRGGPK